MMTPLNIFLDSIIPGDAYFPKFTKINDYERIFNILTNAIGFYEFNFLLHLSLKLKDNDINHSLILDYSLKNSEVFSKIINQIYLFYYSNDSVILAIQNLGFDYNKSPLNEGYTINR